MQRPGVVLFLKAFLPETILSDDWIKSLSQKRIVEEQFYRWRNHFQNAQFLYRTQTFSVKQMSSISMQNVWYLCYSSSSEENRFYGIIKLNGGWTAADSVWPNSPWPSLLSAFYSISWKPFSQSVQCRRLAGLWACLHSVTRQQLCSNGYQDNTVHVTLWFHEGLIDWDGMRRGGVRWQGLEAKELRWHGGGVEWGGRRYNCWELHATFSHITGHTRTRGREKNHSDTQCRGWGRVLSRAQMEVRRRTRQAQRYKRSLRFSLSCVSEKRPRQGGRCIVRIN